MYVRLGIFSYSHFLSGVYQGQKEDHTGDGCGLCCVGYFISSGQAVCKLTIMNRSSGLLLQTPIPRLTLKGS